MAAPLSEPTRHQDHRLAFQDFCGGGGCLQRNVEATNERLESRSGEYFWLPVPVMTVSDDAVSVRLHTSTNPIRLVRLSKKSQYCLSLCRHRIEACPALAEPCFHSIHLRRCNGVGRWSTWSPALPLIDHLRWFAIQAVGKFTDGILDEFPNLAAYVARGEARPAYKRAFDAQLALNTGKAADRLIEFRPGLEVVTRVFVQFMGPDLSAWTSVREEEATPWCHPPIRLPQ